MCKLIDQYISVREDKFDPNQSCCCLAVIIGYVHWSCALV